MADLNNDPVTQSNYCEIRSTHVVFCWVIDWDLHVISGSATHTLLALVDNVESVIFDTSALDVHRVSLADRDLPFILGALHPVMGRSLKVILPKVSAGEILAIAVHYKTTDKGVALQWLSKEQTFGKAHPFLFSQCQPIHARSLAPLQDTSSAKITWSAEVFSKYPVLLSALHTPPSPRCHAEGLLGLGNTVYSFTQPVPIPTYLIAIAAGNLEYRAFPSPLGRGWKMGIWAEPEILDASEWEFKEDAPRFMLAAEEMLVPYHFGGYDMLVLPPAFPYGGMENACLTFLTPTLLSGDRALVDVVAHELMHSWFGNGVTQANASHFWLNEGWTTYMERLLLYRLRGEPARGFSYIIGSKALQDAIVQFEEKPKYRRLIVEFEKGEDPDDAYSSIPYEKGANLLLYLGGSPDSPKVLREPLEERQLGGVEVFLPYVRDYLTTFLGKSITTEDWKRHLYAFFTQSDSSKVAILDDIDWEAWLHGESPELPVIMHYDSSMADRAISLCSRWDQARTLDPDATTFSKSDIHDFDTNQTIVFLEKLMMLAPLPRRWVIHLGVVYDLSAVSNAEIRARYYGLALKSPAAEDVKNAAAYWVVDDKFQCGGTKGRMKFCRPIFRAIARVDLELAVSTYELYKHYFHPIARRLIAKDLAIGSEKE